MEYYKKYIKEHNRTELLKQRMIADQQLTLTFHLDEPQKNTQELYEINYNKYMT